MDQIHRPEEFGPSDNRRMTCSCGHELPCPHADSHNFTTAEKAQVTAEPHADQYGLFKQAVLEVVSSISPERDMTDFDEYDHENNQHLCLTWLSSEEDIVDKTIRAVRNKLLGFPQFDTDPVNNTFIFKVSKSHIRSHNYWSVSFSLSKSYQLLEDSRP